jgi:predicted dehydrogenase
VKPLTPTLAEARALVELAREKRCYGAVEFHKRFDETNLYARKIIDANALGQLLYFTVDYSQRISIPMVVFRKWASRTNIFQYLAVHYVDLIHFLTGFIPERALAIGTRGILHDMGVTEYDSVHATILWRNPSRPGEVVSQFSVNWIDPDRSSALSDQKYKIVGTKGRLELDQKNRGVDLVTEEAGVQAINPYFSEFLPDSGRTAFSGYGHRSIERILRDVQDLRVGRVTLGVLEGSRPSFESALPSVAVTEAVNASLANGSQWEAISEVF